MTPFYTRQATQHGEARPRHADGSRRLVEAIVPWREFFERCPYWRLIPLQSDCASSRRHATLRSTRADRLQPSVRGTTLRHTACC
jgi:hypothetical protein